MNIKTLSYVSLFTLTKGKYFTEEWNYKNEFSGHFTLDNTA